MVAKAELIPITVKQGGDVQEFFVPRKSCDLAQFSLRHPDGLGWPDIEEALTAALTNTSLIEAVRQRPFTLNIVGEDGQPVILDADLEDYIRKGETVEVIIY